MKKIIFSFLICVFSVLFFVGCGPATSNGGDTLQSLSTPTQPQVERVEDRIIVSTSKVENAKAYQFSINNVNFTVNSNVFDGVILLNSTKKDRNIKIMINWNNNEANNETDSIIAENGMLFDMKINFKQYLG